MGSGDHQPDAAVQELEAPRRRTGSQIPLDGGATGKWSTIPLIEPIRKAVAGTGAGYDDSQYPNNIYHYNDSYGETPHSGMANTISAVWAARGGVGDYITAHSVVGWSGHCLSDIDKKGGKRAYLAAMSEARIFKKLAEAAGKTYGVGAMVLTHGECDSTNANYESGLYQMWQDYNTDLKAITGQKNDIVLLISQQSASPQAPPAPRCRFGRRATITPVDRLHRAEVRVRPLRVAYAGNGLRARRREVRRGVRSHGEPGDRLEAGGAQQDHAQRSGHHPRLRRAEPPLVWDQNLNQPHQTVHTAWAKGRGFEVIDGAKNEIAIASIEIQR